MRDANEFFYQELTPGGEPIGEEQALSAMQLVTRVCIVCPAYSLRNLDHMIALAKAGNGHPVDLVQWSAEKTSLVWSARLRAITSRLQ